MSKVSDDAGIYSMFRLKLHEGGGFPIAGVFEHCYLVKPWHLSKFGASNGELELDASLTATR